jgi:transcriptional regulator with XRE-family HTH domain
MINNCHKFIKGLRLKKSLSQADVAEKMSISRSSYIAFEQGKRDLSLAEASKLADFFGISLEEVESGLEPNLEKYKEMILACLRFGGAGDGKIPKTKLAKLLYLSDFAWFYEKLSSMSGMQYRRLPYGPVPDLYFRALDELEDAGKIVIDRKKDGMLLIKESESNTKQVLSLLDPEEKQLIKAINKNWLNKKTEEIVNFTHNQMPYFLCRDNEIIPYELITQESPDNVY